MSISRNSTPLSQFFIFCSVNIGILGLIMGGIIAMFNLSFYQCIAVAILGPASYFLVGIVSIAGHDRGANTLSLSQEVFGTRGNFIPNLIAWIQFLGWLIINVVSSALIIESIVNALNIQISSSIIILSVILIVAISCICCLVSIDRLVKIEKYLTIIFGTATVLILLYLINNLDFTNLMQRESGSFFTDFLPALSIMIAGTGIGWVLAGGDYSCNVKENANQFKIFLAVTLGGLIPLSIMFISGVLMSAKMDLASSDNPLDLIANALPAYFAIPYYLISLGGLLPQCIIGLKTSDINFNTIFKRKIKKPVTSIIIHALILLIVSLIALLSSSDLLLNFQAFLTLTGIGVSAWAAIFITDFTIRKIKNNYIAIEKKKFELRAVISWAFGTLIGLLFTNCLIFTGPFATGVFYNTSLGVLISFFTSLILYIFIRNHHDDLLGDIYYK